MLFVFLLFLVLTTSLAISTDHTHDHGKNADDDAERNDGARVILCNGDDSFGAIRTVATARRRRLATARPRDVSEHLHFPVLPGSSRSHHCNTAYDNATAAAAAAATATVAAAARWLEVDQLVADAFPVPRRWIQANAPSRRRRALHCASAY